MSWLSHGGREDGADWERFGVRLALSRYTSRGKSPLSRADIPPPRSRLTRDLGDSQLETR